MENGNLEADYPKCKCGKNPALEPECFDMATSEFGSFDTILSTEIKATCRVCGDVFAYSDTKERSVSADI